MKRLKRLPEDEVKFLTRQLIEALRVGGVKRSRSNLQYLEGRELVHRDLKCENVFLDAHDNIKLGDFGFARHLRKGEARFDLRADFPRSRPPSAGAAPTSPPRS